MAVKKTVKVAAHTRACPKPKAKPKPKLTVVAYDPFVLPFVIKSEELWSRLPPRPARPRAPLIK